DKELDMAMARRVGARGVMVLTGYGAEELTRISGDPSALPDQVARNLPEAVTWIVREIESRRRSLEQVSSEKKRILVIKPSSLGDILHGLPVLSALRERWPQARISWVVKEQWADILQGHPYIDELILLKKNSLTSGFRAFRKRLRQGRYDLAIDLQGLFRSGLIASLSGAPIRLGFANAREMATVFYTHRLNISRDLHAVQRNLDLMALIGWKPSERFQGPAFTHFPLFVGLEASRRVADFLNRHLKREGPLIVILPGSRWDKKRWPARNFAHLGTLLNEELKADIILLGAPQEVPLIQEIQGGLKGPSLKVTDFTLREMVSLLSRADLLVTNDSGPMHAAAAVGTSVVALFGPTDPGRTGPYGQAAHVIQKPMECSPCFRKPCIHDRFVCMESISVEEVLTGVKRLLRDHAQKRS
ncbi:MAG: lipopolysaccharide heptosyltransferase II, partial [Nitrospirae bacterium]|nr:lipopolysaccharide heptosyltransferase II [Nitrospirota bacterium]